MVSDRLYITLTFLQNLHSWGRECQFERQMTTAHQPVFSAWINVEMYVDPAPCRGLRHELVLE